MLIDIIAPGTTFAPETLKTIQKILESWGFDVRIPCDIFGQDLLCANTDEQRFQQLKNALYSKDSQIVWAARGGYGSARLLPALSKLPPPPKQKLFLSFSDITALHIFLQQQWGWKTLHSPGATQVALNKIDPTDIETLKNILLGKTTEISLEIQPLNNIPINVQATVTGGNLSLVQTSIGTFWQLDTRNKIVFLEEVNERGYKIDRMLEHLRQAGLFEGIHALLLGDFIKGEEPSGTSLIEPVLQRFANSCNFPVLRCPGVGHGFHNHSLPFNTPAILQSKTNKILFNL